MKDIYELLNEVEMDLSDIEELAAEEGELRRIKSQVAEKIKRQREACLKSEQERGEKKTASIRSKKVPSRKRKAAVAAAAVVMAMLVGVAGLGIVYPAYAKEIPIIGDIFRYIDQGRTGNYDFYKQCATNIDLAKAADGYEVTLNDGIFDGTTLTLTYTVRTEGDLGEHPYLDEDLQIRKGKSGWLSLAPATAVSGSQSFQKLEAGVYVGQSSFTFFDTKIDDPFLFRWSFYGMTNTDEDRSQTEKAEDDRTKLHFDVALTKLTDQRKNLNAAVSDDAHQLSVIINKISLTPANAILYYSKKAPYDVFAADVTWTITDDIGNRYEYEDNGGYGKSQQNGGENESVITFQRPDPHATQLILTPHVELGRQTGGGVAIAPDGTETVASPRQTLPKGVTAGNFDMEQIIIDISDLK